MDVFHLRDQLVEDYREYVESFIQIKDERIRGTVEEAIENGLLWPAPLVQLNPTFESGETVDELVADGTLHPECGRIFRIGKEVGGAAAPGAQGRPLLHRHQVDAIRAARTGANYVLTTGTGSGKSLAYIVPIVDHVLRRGSGKGIQAIVVYPMNALANSQLGELEQVPVPRLPRRQGAGHLRALHRPGERRGAAWRSSANPPDILLTNYVMLELILTRPSARRASSRPPKACGSWCSTSCTPTGAAKGADVALLVRRVRDRLAPHDLQVVGTSATLAGRRHAATSSGPRWPGGLAALRRPGQARAGDRRDAAPGDAAPATEATPRSSAC